MSLSQRLSEYIAAAFTGIWIQSHEHHDALVEIARMCKDNKWPPAIWDIDRGLQSNGQAAAGTSDPLAAIRTLPSLASKDSSALLVLPNFHRLLQSTEIIQTLARQIQEGKNSRTFVVVLSPVVQIPLELEKAFVVIEHDLPDRQPPNDPAPARSPAYRHPALAAMDLASVVHEMHMSILAISHYFIITCKQKCIFDEFLRPPVCQAG